MERESSVFSTFQGGIVAQIFTLKALKATINQIRHEEPPVSGRFSPQPRVLAENYRRMVFARTGEVDLDRLPENFRPTSLQSLVKDSANPSATGQ